MVLLSRLTLLSERVWMAAMCILEGKVIWGITGLMLTQAWALSDMAVSSFRVWVIWSEDINGNFHGSDLVWSPIMRPTTQSIRVRSMAGWPSSCIKTEVIRQRLLTVTYETCDDSRRQQLLEGFERVILAMCTTFRLAIRQINGDSIVWSTHPQLHRLTHLFQKCNKHRG